MWGLILGTAAGAATANPVLVVLSIYGLARVIHDLTTSKDSVAHAAHTAKDVMNAVIQPAAPKALEQDVALDFTQMAARWEEDQERGVYAYLRENDIAKDWEHGQYIIHKIFLPEYQRRKEAALPSDGSDL